MQRADKVYPAIAAVPLDLNCVSVYYMFVLYVDKCGFIISRRDKARDTRATFFVVRPLYILTNTKYTAMNFSLRT